MTQVPCSGSTHRGRCSTGVDLNLAPVREPPWYPWEAEAALSPGQGLSLLFIFEEQRKRRGQAVCVYGALGGG